MHRCKSRAACRGRYTDQVPLTLRGEEAGSKSQRAQGPSSNDINRSFRIVNSLSFTSYHFPSFPPFPLFPPFIISTMSDDDAQVSRKRAASEEAEVALHIKTKKSHFPVTATITLVSTSSPTYYEVNTEDIEQRPTKDLPTEEL
jgi:hypothetical protein